MTSPTTTLTSNDDDSSEAATDAATKNAASSRSRFPFIAGLLVAVIGLAFLAGGVVGWFTVKAELEDEHVTVSEDADHFGGEPADGPFSAYYQAQAVKGHVSAATGGKTYAELEQDDPNRDMALQGATVRSSLMTATLSFGVSALAAGAGVVSLLTGAALMVRNRS
jgi:hypothetical protein